MLLGEQHARNNAHCRHRPREAVWSDISADFRHHVACDPSDHGRTHENVRRILKECCETHGCARPSRLTMLPALNSHQRMDLEHVAALGGTVRTQNAVFIGRKARIAQVEIVFKVMVSADKQKQITSGGQVIEHG
jgi:hypothetical protein